MNKSLLLLFLLLILSGNPARGQDIELAPVEITAHPPPLFEAYASVSVVRPEEGDLATGTAADLLERVPGMQVLKSGTPGHRQAVTIRGSSTSQVLVLLEGFDTAAPQAGSADLSLIPAQAVESIEVYRGPRGAAAGAGALGGIVVVRLRKGNGSQIRQRLTGSGFALGGPDGSSAALAARKDNLSFTYEHQHGRGRFPFVDTNGAGRIRENNDSASDRLVMLWSGRPSARGPAITAVASASLAERGSAGLEQFPSPEAREASQSYLAGVRLKAPRFPADSTAARLSASWALWNWRFEDPHPYLGPPADSRSANQRIRGTAGLDWHGLPTLRMGLELTGTGELASVHRWKQDPLSPDRGYADGVLSASWSPKTARFELSGRLRTAAGPAGRIVPVPGLDARFDVSERIALLAAAGRAWRLPTFDELYFESSSIRGNPGLSPEDSIGADAGIELAWKGGQATLTGFWQHVMDSILFLQTGPYLVEAVNTGVVSVLGAEAAAAHRTGPWSIEATAALLDTTWAETGRELPLKSRYAVGLESRLALGPVTLYSRAHWRSHFHLGRFASRTEEGRVFWDAGISAEPGAGIRLALDARNLLDKRDAIDSFQHPLPGMSWYLTVEKTWEDRTEDRQ